uniref:Uncharacterized protein n=1 Tax=Cuerna arida TaxID=1464854 RepID=A0A1B6EYL6_9HEMI
MMEVEESSTTEDSSIEQKVELKEEKKAELEEEKKVECREEKKVELGEEKKVELGKELKVENGVQELNCKETEDKTNERGVEIVNKDKIEETSVVKDDLSNTEINSERSENKMEDESSENPVEASAEDSKVNVENISENQGQSELKEEKMGKPSEKNIETLEGDSKEKSEIGVEANCGSELKLEKNTSEGKVETHEDKLKENCDNKSEDSCRTESNEDKGLCEDETSEEHLTTIEKESKDNTDNLILNSVPSGTNISTKSLQEKERAEIADVESNADKTNIASTETSLLKADKEDKSQSAIAITQESVSHEKNTENQTENNIEFTKDDINKPSPENPSTVHEKLTEKKDLDSQENILTSNSSKEQSTSEKDSRINNEDVKIEEPMEVEPRVELETKSQEDMAVKDSDGSVEVEKSCDSMEDESTSELKTESHNSESLEEDSELKSSESKKEPEMDSAKSPIEKSKLEPIQDKSNADCKSDLKMEESTLSEIVPDKNQKTLISENETVNVEIKKATSENSLAIMSDNVNNTQMDCETKQIVTEGKQKGACIEDCKTRINGDSDELMETESQTNTVVSEKKENLGEKCKDTDDKVKESEDELEKLSDETKSNTTCANVLSNETFSNKEELKTETKVAPLAENNKLNAESNGLAKENEETGVKTNVISPSHQTTLDEQVSVNGTGKSEVGNVSNGNAVESQLNGSSSPDVKQEISNDNDVKPIEGKKCDSTENSTPMETVVEA